MKKIVLFMFLSNALIAHGQNVGIGTDKPKSKLHVAGSLRVDSLANLRSNGLVLHNRSGEVYSLPFTGNQNDVLRGDGTFKNASSISSWLTTGNSGTDPSINFLGTTDAKAMIFRVNNIPAGIINPAGGNIALGLRSLQKNKLVNSGGYSNISIGTDALKNNVSGRNLIAIGDSAMFSQTSYTTGDFGYPEDNMAIGSKALYSNINGSGNIAIGIEAQQKNTSDANTSIGFQALASNTTGNANTAVGNIALSYNTVGFFNTAVGYSAVRLGGHFNTGLGMRALQGITGDGNTAVGTSAMDGAPLPVDGAIGHGNNNTAVGYLSLSFGNLANESGDVTVGDLNAALGAYTLYSNEKGYNNTAVGSYALYSNTSAYNNTATGYQSLYAATTGRANVASGFQSLYNTTTGIWNTAAGTLSLLGNTTGSYNTGIGFGADVSTGNLTNATALGYNAKVNASNKVRIGNAAVTRIEGQVPFTTPSDGRFKFNVREDVSGLEFIMRLRPVTYQFDVRRFDQLTPGQSDNAATFAAYAEAESVRRTGFIAQEVEKAAQASGFDFSGISAPQNEKEHYSLSYESFVVPLVKAMQEQQSILNGQQKIIDENKNKLVMMEEQVKTQHAAMAVQQEQLKQLLRQIRDIKNQLSAKQSL